MALLSPAPSLYAPLERPASRLADDKEVREAVRGLFCHQFAQRTKPERRQRQRQPYPYPIEVTPLVDDIPQFEDTFAVLGKHLSEYGLDFYCDQPLPYRRVITRLETSNGNRIDLLLELTWCRFNRFGWYENGGRFLQLIRPA